MWSPHDLRRGGSITLTFVLGALVGNSDVLAQSALPPEDAIPDDAPSPAAVVGTGEAPATAETPTTPAPAPPLAPEARESTYAPAPAAQPLPSELLNGVGIDANRRFDWTSVNLEELLNVPVTSASKETELASEAPSSVTVFTRADIARLGITTVERLLNFVPGFQGTTDGGNGLFRLSARGRSTIAHEYVLVLIDGQRINDAYTGGIIDPLAVENIRQIEVIRGPGSSLYGANAFLGVIDIKTVRGANGVTAGIGNLNSRYAAVNLGKSFGDLKLSSFARFYSDDGYRTPGVADIMGRSVTAYDPSKQLDFALTAEYKGLTFTARHMERLFEGLSCCSAYSQYSDRTTSAQSSARLGYRVTLAEGLGLDVGASLSQDQRMNLNARSPVGAIPDPRSPIVLTETYLLGTKWLGYAASSHADLNWRVLSRDWVKGTLMLGGSYDYVSVPDTYDLSSHDTNWAYLGDVYAFKHPGISRNTAAGYVQAKIDLWSRLQVTTGTRYDWYSDFGHAVSPRAALVYTTPIKSNLKLMYGRAFRAPSFMELYDRPLRVAPTAHAALEAETIETIELGYTQQLLDYAQGSLTYFHNKLDNIIQPPQNILPYRNFGSSTMQGLELELRTREIHGFHLLGSYTHLMPTEAERPTLVVPFDFGSVALTYAWERLTANLSCTFSGKSKAGGQTTAGVLSTLVTYDRPSYALFNAHVQIKLVSGLRAFGLAENLFDSRFLQSNGTPLPPGLLTRGRTFIVGVRADM